MDLQRYARARPWLLLAAAILLLCSAGCDQTKEPTAVTTSTGMPSATTAAVAAVPSHTTQPPPTLLPTNTPQPSPTFTPTETLEPSATPRPTATPRSSPTPAGFYGDLKGGWSIEFPSDWEVKESGEAFPSVIITEPDLQIMMMVGWQFLPSDDSVDDVTAMMTEVITEQWEGVEEPTTDQITLADGTMAQRVSVIGGSRPQMKMQMVLAQRGARLYMLVVLAQSSSFESRGRTIESIVSSFTLTSQWSYDVDRNTALVLEGSEPYDLDPATTEDGPSEYVGHLFRGLVMLDTNLQVVPDLAESWEIGGDGRTYTFHMRPEAVFFDGKPVTAHDFKYAWERAADPELGSSKTRTYLGDVVGVKEKLDGESGGISGVVVVDDHTLQVTIDAPKVYFLAKLTWPAAFVVDRETVEAGGDDWWRQPNGVGPFKIERWDDDVIVFGRNDDFYGPSPRLEHVVYLLDAGPSMQLYESDEIDMAGVGASLVDRVEDPADPVHADLRTVANLCTWRVILDASRPPFDDPLVRQAFSYAVDREEIVQVVLKGTVRPAAGPLPPGMPGYSTELAGYSFDPDLALDLLAQSSYGDPASLPPLTFTTSGYAGPSSNVESLIETWREVFGIEIEVELLEPLGFLNQIKEHHGHIFSLGWCADYPDPENFLDVLYHSDSDENLGQYGNPEVDALLEQARTEQDVETRLALYRQAEQMIVDDAASIWLFHSISRVLVKPYVHGYVVLPISVPQLQNMYLDPH